MTDDPRPIACSLSAGDLTARLAEMTALGRDALSDCTATATHAELRFSGDDSVRERLAAIVAAESRCCAFLTLRVTEAPGAAVLTIGAREGAEPVLADLVAAFTARTR
jgi:hypothetical protein